MTAPDRFGLTFSSPGGRYGACIRATGARRDLERWMFDGPAVRCDVVPGLVAGGETRVLALDDGRLLLVQRDPADEAGRHAIGLVEAGADLRSTRVLGHLTGRLGCGLLPGIGGDELGVAVLMEAGTAAHDAQTTGQTTLWRITAAGLSLAATVPGTLTGGVRVGETVLALNQVTAEHRSSGVVVDLASGSWRRFWSVTDTSVDRIVLADRHSGLFLVTTDAGGTERTGWGHLGRPDICFSDVLHPPGALRRPLAIDADGRRVLVQETAGARSHLYVYTPADDRLEPVPAPAGTISGPASWAGGHARVRFTAPDRPPTIASVALPAGRPGPAPRWAVGADAGDTQGDGRWARADLVRLTGHGGPVEAVVYGGPGWRRHPRLVVALHGGPLSAWRFDFDPFFQRLAAAGMAVVAVNPRGSTGYGVEHLRAVVGDWGGPDLDDVLAIAQQLDDDRRGRLLPRPAVLGGSYGGYLALLAACRRSGLWSSCVALAPFLSGPALHAAAGTALSPAAAAAVRRRVDALGGLAVADGSRDVLQLCGALTTPLLLAHGTGDGTVPVEQSRALHARMARLHSTDELDLEYVEVDGGHEEVGQVRDDALARRVAAFLESRFRGEEEEEEEVMRAGPGSRAGSPSGLEPVAGRDPG